MAETKSPQVEPSPELAKLLDEIERFPVEKRRDVYVLAYAVVRGLVALDVEITSRLEDLWQRLADVGAYV